MHTGPKQHTSVQRGDALRHVVKHAQLPVVRLSEVLRQRDPADREISKLLGEHRVIEAFARAQSTPMTEGIAAKKFCKAKTIAARLGLCSRTIFRWADDGRIARHKINARVVLFDEAEVIALVEAARVECG